VRDKSKIRKRGKASFGILHVIVKCGGKTYNGLSEKCVKSTDPQHWDPKGAGRVTCLHSVRSLKILPSFPKREGLGIAIWAAKEGTSDHEGCQKKSINEGRDEAVGD